MEISKMFMGAGYAGVNAAGVFPAIVQVSNYWTDAGQTSQVKFNNLDLSRKYRIGCFGSNTNNDYTTANYICNGKTVELNSYYNSTKVVYLDRLVPNDDGAIVLNVTTAGGSPYSFTGAFTIEYYDDPTPAGPVVNTIYPNGIPASLNRTVLRTLAEATPKSATAPASSQVTASKPAASDETPPTVLAVYPNPFKDVIKVDMESKKEASVNILVYDINGRPVFKSSGMNVMKGNNIISADLPAGLRILPGTYIVSIWVDGRLTKTVKLI